MILFGLQYGKAGKHLLGRPPATSGQPDSPTEEQRNRSVTWICPLPCSYPSTLDKVQQRAGDRGMESSNLWQGKTLLKAVLRPRE